MAGVPKMIYGSPMADIKIIDTATPFLRSLAKEYPAYFRRALKSAGWWLSREIKTGIRYGAPGGEPYPEFSKIKSTRNEYETITLNRISKKTGQPKQVRRRIGSKGRLTKETGEHKPLGKLANAVGYKYYADSNRVLVGWLSQSAVMIGEKLEKGFQRPITPRMRRYFFASGLPLSSKSNLLIPAYKTYDPIYRKTGPQVYTYIQNKIFQYIAEAEVKS